MCYAHGLAYEHIVKAMAYGFLYKNDKDFKAVELQEKILHDGIEQTIVDITGFDVHHEVTKKVLWYYHQLQK